MHNHDTMKTIAKAYLSSRGCSVQETVYHILSELKLPRIFPAMYFGNIILPEERVQVLLSEKERSELPGDSPNIFKISNINRYMERPNATFFYAEYKQFLLCRFENKSTKPCEYQPDELDDNHKECSYRSKTFFFFFRGIVFFRGDVFGEAYIIEISSFRNGLDHPCSSTGFYFKR